MSLKKNFLFSIIYQILILIIPLATAPYISRVIGAEGLGVFSYTQSIVQFFCLFALLGVANYGNRSIAAIRENKYECSKVFWNIYSMQIITTSFVMVIYYIYLIFFAENNILIMKVQSIYIMAVLLDISWFYFGLEKFKFILTRNILIRLISFILIFVIIKTEDDIIKYILLVASSELLTKFLLWTKIKSHIMFIRPKIRDVYKHLKPNLILFIPALTISIYKIMDKIMVGSMSTMIQSGFYENSVKIINIPMGVITALGTVMLPRMSNMFASGEVGKSKLYIRNSMQLALFLSFAITFGLCAISYTFTPWYFGYEFAESSPIIFTLAISIVFITWANVLRSQYLIPNKQDKTYIISVASGAVVNLIFNFFLIRKYGAFGAAIGTVIAEFTVTIVQSYLVRKELDYFRYLKDSTPFMVSGAIMYFIVSQMSNWIESGFSLLILQITVGASIYIFISGILLWFTNKERYLYIINEFKIISKE